MFVTIPLNKEQLSKAIGRKQSLAKADLELGCPCPKQYQDQGLSQAGGLVGWIPNHFGGTLKLGYNELVYNGPRDMTPVIKDVILEICGEFPECEKFKDTEFSGLFKSFDYYIGTDRAIKSTEFRIRMDYQTVLTIVQDMLSGKSPVNPETITELDKFVAKLPSYPKPGTATYVQAAAAGTLGGFKKNDLLKNQLNALKSRLHSVKEAEVPA